MSSTRHLPAFNLRPYLPVLLLVACYGILVVAWVFTNPAGASSDETDHYLRALAVGRGDLRGRPNPDLANGELAMRLPKSVGQYRLFVAWGAKGARLVHVPGGIGPHEGFGCSKGEPSKTASCLNQFHSDPLAVDRLTAMGTVEPAPYVLPGLAARFAGGPVAGLLLARSANALVVILLVAGAAIVLWTLSPVALLGLMVGVTPTVVFVSSALGGSAIEMAGAVSFFAALLTLTMGPQPPRRLVWATLGAGGALLAASRSLGPVWIAMGGVAVVSSEGWTATWARVRSGGRAAAGAIAAIGISSGFTVSWEMAFQPGLDFDLAYFRHELGPSAGDLPRIGREMIGVFGWLDTRMQAWAYTSWTALATALIVLALLVGTRRQRLVLICMIPTLLAVTFFVSAGLLRQNGYLAQGRHVVALATFVPLFAGAVVAVNRARFGGLWPRWSLLWFAAPAIGLQALGWYTNAKRYAVGVNGPAGFIGSSQWTPPWGWWLWTVMVAVAVAAGLVGAALACRAPAVVVSKAASEASR